MIKLSHSAQDKYLTCSEEYRLHYIEKIRPVNIGSALVFGTAIDKACENYIMEREPLRARRIFDETFRTQTLNGEEIELSNTTKIDYLASDFDHEIIPEYLHVTLLADSSYANIKDAYNDLKDKERTGIDAIRWNALNWSSLYFKGRLLVNAFMDFVDENIEECYQTQATIELEHPEIYKIINKEGEEVEVQDKITGMGDFVVKLKDHAHPVILDLKTSSRYYDKNSVKESKQLALYTLYFREIYPGMKKAGYLVLNKNIKKNREKICTVCGHDDSGKNTKTCTAIVDGKRCNGEYTNKIYPEATVQFVLDEIPESMIESVLDGFNQTRDSIRANKFEKNLEACVRFNGKIKCPYYEYCRSGCMTGLIKKE